MSEWVRNEPDSRENALAAAAAAGVGLVVGAAVFYVGRLILARDPLPPRPSEGSTSSRDAGNGSDG